MGTGSDRYCKVSFVSEENVLTLAVVISGLKTLTDAHPAKRAIDDNPRYTEVIESYTSYGGVLRYANYIQQSHLNIFFFTTKASLLISLLLGSHPGPSQRMGRGP